MGVIYERGLGRDADLDKALAYYVTACEGGDTQGCRNRAIAGFHQDNDIEATRAWLARGCAGDAERACDELAQGALNPRTQAAIIAIIETLGCDRGQAVSCSNLAASYMGGLGVTRDEARGMALFTQACDQGLPLACRNLAANLMLSRAGNPPDPEAARRRAEQGCAGAQADACFQDALRWGSVAPRRLLLET